MANIFENQYELVRSFARPTAETRSFDTVINEKMSRSVSLLKFDPRLFGHFLILGLVESIINSNLRSELGIHRIFVRKFNQLSLRVVLVYQTVNGAHKIQANSLFFDNVAEITTLTQNSELVWPHGMPIYEMGLNNLEYEAIRSLLGVGELNLDVQQARYTVRQKRIYTDDVLANIQNTDRSRSAHRTVLEFSRVQDDSSKNTYNYRTSIDQIPKHDNARYDTIIDLRNRPFVEISQTGHLDIGNLIYGIIVNPGNILVTTIVSNYMSEVYMSLTRERITDWTSPALSDCYCGFTLGFVMPFEKRFSYETLVRHDFDTIPISFPELNDPNEDIRITVKYDRPMTGEGLDHSFKLILHSKFNLRSSIYSPDLLWLIEFQSGSVIYDYSTEANIVLRQGKYSRLVHSLNSLNTWFTAGIARYAFRPQIDHWQSANFFILLNTYKREDDFYARVRNINTARLLAGSRDDVARVRRLIGRELAMIEPPSMAHPQNDLGRVGRHFLGAGMVSNVDMNRVLIVADRPDTEDRLTSGGLNFILTMLEPHR